MVSAAADSQALQELIAELKAYPDGSDLLLTALYTAAFHYRRSTICTPFPNELLPPLPDTKDKDFPALQRALGALPPVQALLSGGGQEEVLRRLPPAALGVLTWLLLHPARRRHFGLVSLGEMLRQLRQRAGGGGLGGASGGGGSGGVMGGVAAAGGGGPMVWQVPAFAGHNSPTFVLRAHDSHTQEPFAHGAVAYHGTHLENLHSILHAGLQSGSGTRLQRTGANFGAGIYLSTNYDTAFSFCQPCPSWPLSRFGTKLRVLLVCEVDLDLVRQERGAEAEAAAAASSGRTPHSHDAANGTGGGASSSGPLIPGLPDTYLLVQRSDAVRILFVAIYTDAAAPPAGAAGAGAGAAGAGGGPGARRAGPLARVNWCTVMVVLYAGFLVGKALLAALKQHRY
ncbi:hypothetical protein CHLRE_17g738550v5 [Chlamydomonas reinhardtii]|uniref:Poly [ADP-ribose] polymerase n=1 Tax=Chlamydomonas reinhardtii TaxID=3055 RepID=A0A2K3CRK7_CHLRE|nr:uncharacterized protein CHLRE_17g738550v5 [Chlamydomonas reinhardtii]PNW70909.1 hypothetical protein CHLRE_17g738550v5 [Chlamydomonas reinhardtii]